MDALIIIALLLLLLAVGIPVAVALALSGIIGMVLIGRADAALGFLSTTPYRIVSSYSLTIIPMFIFMASLGSRSGLVSSLFDAGKKWLSFLPGGLAIATTMAAGAVAAMSGSSAASSAMLAKMAVPEMKAAGYGAKLSMGVVCCAGTFAIMIPPSIGLVLYGIITETSIGKLLIAGVIPGILTVLVYCLIIIFWVKLRPEEAPKVDLKYSWKEKVVSLTKVWPVILLMVVILGVIFTGVATPSEAGAIGAFSMIMIVAFFSRSFKGFKGFSTILYDSFKESLNPTAMILFLMIGAQIMGYALVCTGFTKTFALFITSLDVPAVFILILIILVMVLLGTIVSQIPLMFITLPLLFPVVVQLGYNPIWFGIIMAKLAEIGVVTPPLGVNAYVTAGATNEKVETVFSGIMPFLLADIIVITLLIAFPEIATFLLAFME